MKVAYFDCFSGIAGDMILAALIDAGCPLAALQETVRALQLPGVTLSAEKLRKSGLSATYVRVDVPPEARKKHRHLPQITAIIDAAGLAPAVAARARRVFERLAEAEAQVHGTTIDKVHFHEVGAADAIVDIVAASAALELLKIDAVHASAVPTGCGTVVCEHGVMPVPAPATALLLRGVPLMASDEAAELTTPTGAAFLTSVAARFGGLPAMQIEAIGYGAGTRESQARPNVVRVIIGSTADAGSAESDVVTVLETDLDDADGQHVAHAAEQLRLAGALDVTVAPIMMKKDRPGSRITVLCRPADADALERVIFRETTTFGIRRHEATRTKLAREWQTVATSFGDVRVKIGRQGGRIVQAWPEFDDCAVAAERHGVPLRDVQSEALAVWRRGAAADSPVAE
ncbi:MAG: Pyridinium-3,5-bisthiocarboxylic acid mononucleotide nickel insertion protein [Phycisphaerae bacterium]|nr:Pyridinium-3,5-bisthiocarboxylic acid mononucleotide nickel insertion protein [Phycisphaerae bacterium]